MKIDLKDTSFIVPVRIDHRDRYENLLLVIDYLNHHFDTEIIVCEESARSELRDALDPNKCRYVHVQSDSPHFHRTKILNHMISLSSRAIVVNYDTDVLLPVSRYVDAATRLRTGELDVVLPHDGRLISIDRELIPHIRSTWNVDDLEQTGRTKTHDHGFMGLAVFFTRQVYVDGGMENENFVSFGWEDNERFERFTKLGYRVGRLPGGAGHVRHFRGENSSATNAFAARNQAELEKVRGMSKEELQRYVQTWPWARR